MRALHAPVTRWLQAGLLLIVLSATVGQGTVAPQSAAAAESQTIVAIGDSIVFGLHDDEARGGWVGRLSSVLQRSYPGQVFHVINAGVNGDTSAGVLRRLDKDVIAVKPNLVILAIGTNDFDMHVPAAVFGQNLQAIVQRLQAKTHAAVLVQSFLPQARVSDQVLRREAAYNALVPQVCRRMHVGYLDLFNTFLALGRSAMAQLRHDSEHPTAAGYRFMTAETAAMIEGAYADSTGVLQSAATPPGLDDFLPDDSLGESPTLAG